MLASHFLPVKFAKAFLKLTLNAGDSGYSSERVGAIELDGEGLNSSCPFSEATA